MTLTHSLNEAAQLIGCSERWLADQIRAHRFPARRIGVHWRMTDDDITAALELCKRDATARPAAPVSGLTAESARRRGIRTVS